MSRETQTNFKADSFTGKGGDTAPEPPQAEAESEQPEAPEKEATKRTAKKAADKK